MWESWRAHLDSATKIPATASLSIELGGPFYTPILQMKQEEKLKSWESTASSGHLTLNRLSTQKTLDNDRKLSVQYELCCCVVLGYFLNLTIANSTKFIWMSERSAIIQWNRYMAYKQTGCHPAVKPRLLELFIICKNNKKVKIQNKKSMPH